MIVDKGHGCGRDEALTRLIKEGRDEALTRLTEEDGVGHGNAIASLIETRMVLRAATQCFITCET